MNINIIDLKVETKTVSESDYISFNEICEVIRFNWTANIGCGEYTLYKTIKGNWRATSGNIDTNTDKSVLKALMMKFIDQIEVVE